MLTAIRVKNYKGLSDIDLWKLTPITLIGGRNNVGKSSLLEAVFAAMDRLNPEMLFRMFSWRGVVSVKVDPDAMWRPSFGNYDFSQPISIELKDSRNKWLKVSMRHEDNYRPKTPDQSRQSVSGTGISVAGASSPSTAIGIYAHYDDKLIQDSHTQIQNNSINFHIERNESVNVSECVFIPSSLRISPSEDANRFGILDVERRTGDLVEVLQTIEPRLQGLSVVAIADQTLIHAEVDGFPRKIPVALMGDGIARMTTICLAILASRAGIVLVDEIEAGLHHSALRAMWATLIKVCNKSKAQLIATTHSYECVSAAQVAVMTEPEDFFTYLRLERSRDGKKINSVRFSSEEIGTAIEAEMEIR